MRYLNLVLAFLLLLTGISETKKDHNGSITTLIGAVIVLSIWIAQEEISHHLKNKQNDKNPDKPTS